MALMQEVIKKADVLIEALPYIRAFRGKAIVVKYGGSAMSLDESHTGLLQDIVFMNYVGLRPILVHGGGPSINERLKSAGLPVKFIDGMRVTDDATMRIVDAALTDVNTHLVQQLRDLGGSAAGLTANHRAVVFAKPHAKAARLGQVGEIDREETAAITRLLEDDKIPVISPIGMGADKRLYNINADEAAGHIAAGLKAEKLVLLTDVQGILRESGEESEAFCPSPGRALSERRESKGSLIQSLSVQEAKQLIGRKVIQSGMIPKVLACIAALEHGVKKTHIIAATMPHALLLEIFTDRGVGTEIVR
ncbi:MAG: acetylglutamate kinase [Candidatus Omnitrophica bacterium]|nr:acetylglutamate kinase [Candidatus Omnitrophota bacterium]